MSQKVYYLTMARAGARAYKGVWGCTPCGMQEQRPWGSQWAKSPEAEDILAFDCQSLIELYSNILPYAMPFITNFK